MENVIGHEVGEVGGTHSCKCGHEHTVISKVNEMMKLVRAANDIYDTLTPEEKIEADNKMEELSQH